MYASLWRTLPGPVWFRILLLLALVAVVLIALATWVFPWVDSLINSEDVTVGT